MTHHFAMTSSLLIKILKIDKFGVFSSDIDFKTKMDIFKDDISRLINQCHLQATEGVSASRAAQASEARLLLLKRENRSYMVKYLTLVVEILLISLKKPLQWWC